MKSEILYIMKCKDGLCECTRDEIETVFMKNKGGTTSPYLVCKKHGGRIYQRKRKCNNPECGKDFYGGKSSGMSLHCNVCRKRVQIIRSRMSNATISDKRFNDLQKELDKITGAKKENGKAKKRRIVINSKGDHNRFGCLKFGTFCGFCIRPWFETKMCLKNCQG